MIELKITGCCAGCRHIDLRLDSYFADFRNCYQLRCVHDQTCMHLDQERIAKAREHFLDVLTGGGTAIVE